MKYTRHGKVLLGCRRHDGTLNIQVWDTGIGIPTEDLGGIFEEFRQLDNPAHERGRGFGLGLSIVQRLGNLLGHEVSVRSHLGKGSVFALEVTRLPSVVAPHIDDDRYVDGTGAEDRPSCAILVVEADRSMRELLGVVLRAEGHSATTAQDGDAALDLVARGMIRPDLILADYGLPNGMNGLQVAARLREALHREIPLIILTGDISTATLREIAREDCLHLNKPVKATGLTRAIQRLAPVA